MTISEMHTAFKVELDKTSSLELPAFEPEEIDYWLNQGISKFVKNRYDGLNSKNKGFEQSQKRTDDLAPLIFRKVISPNNTVIDDINEFKAKYDGIDKKNSVLYSKPVDIFVIISEEIELYYKKLGDTYSYINSISDTISTDVKYLVLQSDLTMDPTSPIDSNALRFLVYDGKYYKSCVIVTGTSGAVNLMVLNSGLEITISPRLKIVPVKSISFNYYSETLNNPYSEHIMHYEEAKPLRIVRDVYYTEYDISYNFFEFVTDGTYGLGKYYLTYIRIPKRFNSLTTSNITSGDVIFGLKYIVVGSSITYNAITYSVGDTFYGVQDITVFTGTGTLTLVKVNTDLPKHIHDEVVKVAVGMALENIEQPRYNTYSNEINTME